MDKGMVLPFTPLTMTFHDVHYFVDCPPVCTWCPLFLESPSLLVLIIVLWCCVPGCICFEGNRAAA